MRRWLGAAVVLWAFRAAPAAAAVGTCDTVDCLREQILKGQGPAPSEADCRALDGRMDKDDLKMDIQHDLGPICRLLVGRRAAGQRPVAPCIFDKERLNPDWEGKLGDHYSLAIENALLAEAPLAKHKIKLPPEISGWNNSTIFGTYVFDRQFGAAGKPVSFATYFCIADNPHHYVPYYYILKIGGAVADAQRIAKPIEVPILGQVSKFNSEDDQNTFLLIDLNGDGKKDVAILRNHMSARSYTVAACLYEPKKPDCTQVVADPIVVEKTAANMHFAADGRTLVVTATSFNEPVGEWRLHLAGARLELAGGRPAP